MDILGIDLGTTNSLIAYYNDEDVKIIPNRLGEKLTPSAISFNEMGELYVGKIAMERLITYPHMSEMGFKRAIGTDKKFLLNEQEFSAEMLSSLVIRSLVEDAEFFLKRPVTEVVISVPAYFNDLQRKATKRAGELAGVKVERIINEPTAAAIAYGLQDKTNQHILVIDLGGGTFDVSILEIYNDIIEVQGIAGDNDLGGNDFTETIMDMFLAYHELKKEDLSDQSYSILQKQAEQAKMKTGQQKEILMEVNIETEKYAFILENELFNIQIESLLRRLRAPIERVLADTGTAVKVVDHVVLIGGATRLPAIQKFLGEMFDKALEKSINPEEAVVIGASIQAAMKARNTSIKELILTDVCPFSLGTTISMQVGDGEYKSGYYLPIIERNTTIPVSRVERLYTVHENQSSIHVEILQGEYRLAVENMTLGHMNIAIPRSPAGTEAVDIRFTYDINSILEVIVTVVSTGLTRTMIIEQNPGEHTAAEIAKRLEELEMIKIHPRADEVNIYLLSVGERIYTEYLGEERKNIGNIILDFEKVLDKQDPKKIKEAREAYQEKLKIYDADAFVGWDGGNKWTFFYYWE